MRFWKGHRDTYIGWFSVGAPGGLLMSGIINRLFNKNKIKLWLGLCLKHQVTYFECAGTDLYSRWHPGVHFLVHEPEGDGLVPNQGLVVGLWVGNALLLPPRVGQVWSLFYSLFALLTTTASDTWRVSSAVPDATQGLTIINPDIFFQCEILAWVKCLSQVSMKIKWKIWFKGFQICPYIIKGPAVTPVIAIQRQPTKFLLFNGKMFD